MAIKFYEVVADNKIAVHTKNGGCVGIVDNAKTLAYVMKMYGLEETVEIKGGNCLPFHDEILDEALGIYNWEVNGVAG